jgi:hypothetical protein
MNKITSEHLARQACVYIRQSTPGQVQNNLESQRRQYALVDRARQLGWEQVEVIDDDDLGRSSLLRNPIYAGVYAYGRSKASVRIEQGRKRIVHTNHQNPEDWAVMIVEHHEGYIGWDAYQSNQALIAHNTNAKGAAVRGVGEARRCMLSGLRRCGHCGAKLVVQYPGPTCIRYQCASRILTREQPCCVMFGGLGADRRVAEQVLRCLEPLGLEAALQAIENLRGDEDERLRPRACAHPACPPPSRCCRQCLRQRSTLPLCACVLSHPSGESVRSHHSRASLRDHAHSKRSTAGTRHDMSTSGAAAAVSRDQTLRQEWPRRPGAHPAA